MMDTPTHASPGTTEGSSRSRMMRSIHLLYVIFVQPRSQDEDARRREFILNVILVSSLLLIAVSWVLVMYAAITEGAAHGGVSPLIFSVIFLAFFCVYLLSRSGHRMIASELLVILYLAGAAYGSYRWGPDLPASLLSYALVVVIASILLGTTRGFLTALGVAGVITAFGYREAHFGVLPDTHWKSEPFDGNDAIEYSVLLLSIMVVSWLSNREIERSLRRARKSESELREQKDVLEVKVEERTRELRDAQVQRISQLYRFAEFGKLASGFFHDLMSPLTAMSLHVQRLRAIDRKEISAAKMRLDNVLIAAQRMEHFIQAARKQLEHHDILEVFSLQAVILEVGEILRYKSHKAHIMVSYHLGEELFHYGNPLKFHQVVLNLLSNALDACMQNTAEKGVAAGQSKVAITLEEQESTVICTVRDTGSGIPATLTDKIFEPFFTTKGIHKGIGIGLSLTKEIVEKSFHGTITVTSEEGRGTMFTVRFPLLNAPRTTGLPISSGGA